MMLANPSFAASQSGTPLALAGPLHAAGLLLAAVLVRVGAGRARWPAAAVGLPLAVGATLVLGGAGASDGVLVLAALFLGQVLAAAALATALQPRPGPAVGLLPLRVSAGAGVVGVLTIGPLLLHQLDYSMPLPFPHDLVLVAAAAALALAGLRRSLPGPQPTPSISWSLLVGSAAMVVLGTATAAAAASPSPRTDGSRSVRGSGVVLSWNLHYGVTPAGSVELEAVARAIEEQDPDVVLLQEVSRGWVQGGGVDMASWLSQRLGRPFVFAPAADRRFGNVILARERPSAVEVHPLPYGQGPQQRSALSAEVPVGGTRLHVTSVHLQHRATATPTRVRQVQTLLGRLAEPDRAGRPLLVGGDLNAGPGEPEIALLTRVGFISALDAVGDPRALTDSSSSPTRRIDWVLGRGLAFRDAWVISDAPWSDHRPVVVRVAELGGP